MGRPTRRAARGTPGDLLLHAVPQIVDFGRQVLHLFEDFVLGFVECESDVLVELDVEEYGKLVQLLCQVVDFLSNLRRR